MDLKTNTICAETNKITLSESKAVRLSERYGKIKGYYYCDHCKGYHLTSKGTADKFKIIKQKVRNQRINISIKQLRNQILSYKEWDCTIEERFSTVLDEFDQFLEHIKKTI